MNLVGILIGLVVFAVFMAILNLILDKLLPKFGPEAASWKPIILGILFLICLLVFLSRAGLSGGYF
jgi:hypothetical protein